ncbi:MAG: glycosyl hydrolase, partial [Armatimonadetes bacterium]|nr:glycosyl hydrolase [Armatimonadota bacterium]
MNSQSLNNLSRAIRSPVPFWFINGPIKEWQIVREFEMMAEKGISEVIVHPRYGLEIEYLSEEWFLIFGWCVREAKRRGMFVWIYDEFNWPSGTAGMTVQKMDPNYRGKHLAVESKPLHEVDLNEFEPGICMIAANIEGGTVTKTRLLESFDDMVSLTGNWRIFNCTLRFDPYYIDTLSKDAVDSFKRTTYEEYYKRFGDEFGKTIRAIFTDEPSIYWVSVGYDDWNLPYTDDYFSTFESRYGYDCRPMIPYLFYPGREGVSFRTDYWEHAGYLFNERYHRNLGDWCREHGIIYTGHNNHEEPLRYQIRFQGDMFGTMRAMDIPGVDHLGKQTLGNPWISIIGHKICSSEAHFDGKARAMSESFGVMDWDTTFANLKRVVDWQYGLGINLLVPHAIYHTISGMTKRECPPSFFYQSPHWDDFEYFVDYVRRLEEMLTEGRHRCRVAVLYPSSGLWASYQSDRKTVDFEHTDNSLNSLCLELVRNQIDFDLIDFRALSEAAIEDGKVKLADEAYDLLI